ncbi:MAG: galactose oxidase early set domain-containing protein [Planctomycetota bacterium]
MLRFSTVALLAFAVVPDQASAAPAQRADEQAALHITGRWQDSWDFPLALFWPTAHNFKAVHMALIPMDVPMPGGTNLRGKILAWGDHRSFGNEWRSAWMVLDPETQSFLAGGIVSTIHERSLTGVNEGSIFCSGHSWTPEGKLLVAGGMYLPGLKNGNRLVYIFDPSLIAQGLDPWVRQPDLATGRWYPTVLNMADGETMLILGGKNRRSEVQDSYTEYNWKSNTFASLVAEGPPGDISTCQGMYFYPRTHLLPNGDIFFSCFMQNSASVNPATRANRRSEADWDDSYEVDDVQVRVYGESLMLPLHPGDTLDDVRIQVMNGEIYDECGMGVSLGPTGMVEEMSFHNGDSNYKKWSDSAAVDMTEKRWFPNMVILPDQTVTVYGGEADNVVDPRKTPEMRENGVWRHLAKMDSARGYHSTAMLLPDGRVITGGGDHRLSDFQVFEPPYLFRGARPIIVSLSAHNLEYGQTYTLNHTGDVESVVLMRPGSRTHHFDSDQRMVILHEGLSTSGTVSFTMPTVKELTPQGYYMMFAVSPEGVPSFAQWVHVH